MSEGFLKFYEGMKMEHRAKMGSKPDIFAALKVRITRKKQKSAMQIN